MQVKVSYTYVVGNDDLKALKRYHSTDRISPEMVTAILGNIGTHGLEDQVSTGYQYLECDELQKKRINEPVHK